jgi:cytochrome c peroxidase
VWVGAGFVRTDSVSGSGFFWYPVHDHRKMQDNSGPGAVSDGGQEPITPVPLDLRLDARKVALGRRLFHDPRLSHDSTISCAHCHSLANGGVDSLPCSIGVAGEQGRINTPTMFNSGFNFRQFWDGRAATLEDHIDFQKNNPCEMGSAWEEVIAKRDKDAEYRRDFEAVYREGSGGVIQCPVKEAYNYDHLIMIEVAYGKTDRWT